MKQIKYRQLKDGEWHYWGFGLDDMGNGFVGPFLHTPSYEFTGLNDKNGIELYDGSIANVMIHWVNDTLHTAKIVWREDQAMFMAAVDHKNDDGVMYYELPKLRSILVIGNTAQNPELLN